MPWHETLFEIVSPHHLEILCQDALWKSFHLTWLTPTKRSIPPANIKSLAPAWSLPPQALVPPNLVATLVAGSKYGYALLWTVLAGVIMKIVLVEGAGIYSLATGRTIFEGWRTLGRWTSWYFGPYILIWGFVYGATGMSAAAMPLAVLFPVLPLWGWAILMDLSGFAIV